MLTHTRSGQFVYVIRKRIKLSPEKAIFIFVDEVLPPTAALMSAIYDEHKDEDGFLCAPSRCCPSSLLSTRLGSFQAPAPALFLSQLCHLFWREHVWRGSV